MSTATRCAQCGCIGLELQGGRCTTCRHLTPADLWGQMHRQEYAAKTDPDAVQPDNFHVVGNGRPALKSALLPIECMEEARSVTKLKGNRVLTIYRGSDGMRVSYDFPLTQENIPSPAEVYGMLLHMGNDKR